MAQAFVTPIVLHNLNGERPGCFQKTVGFKIKQAPRQQGFCLHWLKRGSYTESHVVCKHGLHWCGAVGGLHKGCQVHSSSLGSGVQVDKTPLCLSLWGEGCWQKQDAQRPGSQATSTLGPRLLDLILSPGVMRGLLCCHESLPRPGTKGTLVYLVVMPRGQWRGLLVFMYQSQWVVIPEDTS